MHDIALSLLVLGGLAVGTTLTGRAVAALLRVRMLRRWAPENVLASAFLGTAVWILTFGCCSYLGLHALPAALVVLGLAGGLVVVRVAALPRAPSARRRGALATVLAPVALAAITVLLPILIGDSFVFWSDSLQYSSVAEWLQGHGFWDACPYDAQHPMSCWVPFWQECNHRMGPTFLLAMMRALFPGSLALYHYQAVIAWGVALNAAAVYLLCRWGFRCGKACALFAAFFVGGVNPLAFSTTNGFLCQVYGTAVLLFALAVLARLATRARWNFGGAALFALTAALQVSVYPELAPVLAAAALFYLAATAVRAWRAAQVRTFAAFAATTFLLFGLFANVEIVRAARGILFMVHLNGTGWHVDWSPLEYWTFAVGARPGYTPLASKSELIATAVCSVLVLAGVAHAIRHRRAWPTLVSLLVLGGLAVHYRWVARDPWTGDVGHTFNLFKLTKWSFPLLVAVQGAGLHFLLRRHVRLRRVLVAAAGLLVVLASAHRHWAETRMIVRTAHGFTKSEAPLSSMRQLRKEVDGLDASAFYFIPPIDPKHLNGNFYRDVIPYLLNSHPFVNGWTDPRDLYYHPGYEADRNAWPPPDGLVGVMLGEPWEPPLRRLPCGLSVMDLRRPFVVGIAGADASGAYSEDRRLVQIGPAGVTIELWSPSEGAGTLSLSVAGPASLLRIAPEGAAECGIAVKGDSASVPLSLHPGINRLSLQCVHSTADGHVEEDASASIVSIVRISLTLDEKQP
jgi:hypothetical protein